MAENTGVFVYCETEGDKLAPIATELLGCARKLAGDLQQEVYAVLIGSGIAGVAQEAIAYGADKVYVVDDPLLKDYQSDAYLIAMENVAKQAMPQIILLGQTSIGRDLTPRLAFRLDTAATLDCIELAIDADSKRLLQTKPVYGGNALAIYTCDADPQIASVRAKAMSPLEADSSRKGEVINIEAGIDPSAVKTKLIEKVFDVTN